MSKERYINLSDRQVKDTQNQSQDFMNINTICRRLNQQDQKISDLEAKLAESEKPKEIRFNGFVIDCNYDEARNNLQKEILKMQEENNELRKSEELQTYAQNILEINQLKQQLAEKEQIIEANKVKIKSLSEINLLLKSDVQMAVKIQNKHSQDKISFAVERLEKVKEHFINIKTSTLGVIRRSEMVMYIDNQIKELKKEMK